MDSWGEVGGRKSTDYVRVDIQADVTAESHVDVQGSRQRQWLAKVVFHVSVFM